MEENKWFQFFQRHWYKCLLGLLTIALVLVWTERLFGKKQTGRGQDYLLAAQIFERIKQGDRVELESVHTAENILNSHRELRPFYETLLAQAFFAQNNPQKGRELAESSLKRIAQEIPEAYVRYAQGTLLILDGQLEEALAESQSLQAEEGSYLEAFNLLRICALSNEKAVWERLREHPRFPEFASLFQEGAVTLGGVIEGTQKLP